jgi:hypothetical protein
VSAPRGDWKNVPARTQERVDNDIVGAIFVSGGGDLLVAVLANPQSSPTAGVNALAIESASGETGSLFVEDFGSGNTGSSSSSVSFQGDTPSVLPESPLLDQGLLDIQNPNSGHTYSNIGHFIGTFAPTGSVNWYQTNYFRFALSFDTGLITDAAFELIYNRPHGTYGNAWTVIGGFDGTGYVNKSTLAFEVGNFPSVQTGYVEHMMGASSYGSLAPSSTFYGSFLGPVSLSLSGQGTFDVYYVPNALSTSPIDMPSSIAFAGGLASNPLARMEGTFNIPNADDIHGNYYDFSVNLNTRAISNVMVVMIYHDTATNYIDIELTDGSGSVTGNSFNINLAHGFVSGAYSYASPTATMTGTLSSSNLNNGDTVTGGSITINAGAAPSYFPTNVPIQDGLLETH